MVFLLSMNFVNFFLNVLNSEVIKVRYMITIYMQSYPVSSLCSSSFITNDNFDNSDNFHNFFVLQSICIPAPVADTGAVSPNRIKIFLANGVNKCFIHGKQTFINFPRTLPRNPLF